MGTEPFTLCISIRCYVHGFAVKSILIGCGYVSRLNHGKQFLICTLSELENE